MYTDMYLELDKILDDIAGKGFIGFLNIHWGVYLTLALISLVVLVLALAYSWDSLILLPLALLVILTIALFIASLMVHANEKNAYTIVIDDKVEYDEKVDEFLELFSIYIVETNSHHDKVGIPDQYSLNPEDYKLGEINEVTFNYNGEQYTKNLYLMTTSKERRDGTFYLTSYLRDNLKENKIDYDGVMLIYVPQNN